MNGIDKSYEDVLWFEIWSKRNGVDKRIYNAVSKNMNLRGLTISNFIDMSEDDFIGWNGFGAKSRKTFVDKFLPKLIEDYYNREENYIHEYSEYKAL